MQGWLSDRRRPVVFAAALAATFALMTWWALETGAGRIGAVEVLEKPVGEEVVLSLLTVVSIDGPDRYVLGHAALRIPVIGPTAELRLGEEITVGGVVEPGAVRQVWVEQAPGRPAKRRLGLVGVAAAVVLLGVGARPERGGLALRG